MQAKPAACATEQKGKTLCHRKDDARSFGLVRPFSIVANDEKNGMIRRATYTCY